MAGPLPAGVGPAVGQQGSVDVRGFGASGMITAGGYLSPSQGHRYRWGNTVAVTSGTLPHQA